jgi:predicted acetyltransferase
VRIRELERHEIRDLWSIDRSEVIDRVYHRDGDELVLEPEHYDMTGWPAAEMERDGPVLLDCFDRGGTFYGAFDGDTLVGAAVLESRFIGRAGDRLQLKFLHVGRRYRRTGLGRALFDEAVARARALGARRLYVSATPSENTVRFYLRRGCRVTDDVDADLFALEPEDIHMELDIPAPATRVEVAEASISDAATLANLSSLYLHDFSEVVGGVPGPDGRFVYDRLRLYFEEAGRTALLIRSDGALAGFALVSRGSVVTGERDVWDLSEFFVVRGLRLRGVGRSAASAVFERFEGRWEVRALDRNRGAAEFWTRAISQHTGGTFEVVPWVSESGSAWRVFRFSQGGGAA